MKKVSDKDSNNGFYDKPYVKSLTHYALLLAFVLLTVCFICCIGTCSTHRYNNQEPDKYEIQHDRGNLQIITSQTAEDHGSSNTRDNHMLNLLVALVGVCATIIVGFQVFNSIEHRHELKKYEDRIKEYDDQFKSYENFLTNTIQFNSILVDADHSRMTAYMLGELNKPVWALGWICRAIKRYFDAYDIKKNNYDSSYSNLSMSCIILEIDNIKNFVHLIRKSVIIKNYSRLTDDNNLRKNIIETIDTFESQDILIRTYKDMIDSRLFIEHNKKENKENDINFYENPSQKSIIESFLTLITQILGPDNINKAAGSSSFNRNKFMQETEQYRTEKNIIELFLDLERKLQTES